jgi:hypothetical protein
MAKDKGSTAVEEQLSTDDIVAKDPGGKEILRIGPDGKDLPDFVEIATEGQIIAAKLIVARQEHGAVLQECVDLSQRTVDLAKEKAEMAKQLAAAYESAAKAQADLGQAKLQLAQHKLRDMEVKNKSLFDEVGLNENSTLTDDPEKHDIPGFSKGAWFVIDAKAREAANKAAENGASA